MLRNITYQKVYENYLALFAALFVAFPFSVGIGSVLFIALVIFGAIKGHLRFEFNWGSGLFVALYLCYVIGTLYTNNGELAGKYLEYKLSLIIFPILFSFRLKEISSIIPRVMSGTIIGTLVVVCYGILFGLHCYSQSGDLLCLQTVRISPVHHPSYLTMFLVFSMAGSWIGYTRKWRAYKLKWIVPFNILGLIIHLMTLSLAGILFLMLIIGLALLYLVWRRWGKIVALTFAAFTLMCGFLIVNYVPKIESEWNGAKVYAVEYINDPQAFIDKHKSTYPMPGSIQRLLMWSVAWEQLKAQPMGAGTGNVDEVLNDRLKSWGHHYLAARNLNPHNQFLQIGVEIGVQGLLMFCGIFIFAFIQSWKYRNVLLLVLAGSFAFNSLWESMMQRQSGIVFFTFWMCLLLVYRLKPSSE